MIDPSEGQGPAAAVQALGVPGPVASGLAAVLGPDAAQRVATDPWLVLEAGDVTPVQADRFAAGRLGGLDPGDPRRVVALCRWVIRRVGHSGATLVAREVVLAALAGLGLGESAVAVAVEHGGVVATADGSLLALAEVAAAEQELAGHVERAGTQGADRLLVVSGPPGPWRDAAVAAAAGEGTTGGGTTSGGTTGGGTTLIRDRAERLDTHAVLALLREVGDGGRVVLAGDPCARHAAPGRVLADLVERDRVAVRRVEAHASTALGRLATAVRVGRLEPADPAEHSLVVAPVDSVEKARHRVLQLVSDSIPGRLGLGAAHIAVVTLRETGPLGAGALRGHLQAEGVHVRVSRVDELDESPVPAVVLVLAADATGSLERTMLVSAVGAASAHLSVVTQVGSVLAQALARPPAVPRTGLAARLGPLEGSAG